MSTFRTTTEVPDNRQVIVTLPSDTPVGIVELLVTIQSQEELLPSVGNVAKLFGTVRSGESRSADNERIDADLAKSYGNAEH